LPSLATMKASLLIAVISVAAADFDAWMSKYGKVYNGDDQYTARKAVYEENMKFVAAENSKDHTYTLGEGPFSDLTNEEFKQMYVSGYNASSQMFEGMPYLGEHEDAGEQVAAEVNWVTKGAVTPVKNQGQCGSCWAFSTTGGLEGAWKISAGHLTAMSEQQFVDCDHYSMGCKGGAMALAFKWATSKNVCTESSYPYKARGGLCRSSCATAIPSGGVTGYKSVGNLLFKATKAKMQSALQQQPVSIAIEADQASFQHYTGGILSGACGTKLDHGVLAVGYGPGYWLVKNSWGASWGENGYVRLTDAGNECGILNQPVYPTVSASVSV